MTRKGFICAGCWTLDRIKLVSHWPREEELALISEITQQGGGSAHNVAIDLKRLDPTVPVATIGMLGNDPDGDYLFDQATKHNIDTTQLYRCNNAATSYTDVISVTQTGKRTFFHYTGANDHLEPHHFEFDKLEARFIHLGLLSLHHGMDQPNQSGGNGWSTVLERAQQHNLLTSIEMVSISPTRNRQLVEPCLPFLDYLIVNDHEIGAIAGLNTLDRDGNTLIEKCLQAAKQVIAAGTMRCVAVHYPTGALCVTNAGEEFISTSVSIPAEAIAGSVGAGDAFVAGFLYALHENWSIHTALQTGHAVAAVSLTSPTTVEGVRPLDACVALASQWAGD